MLKRTAKSVVKAVFFLQIQINRVSGLFVIVSLQKVVVKIVDLFLQYVRHRSLLFFGLLICQIVCLCVE